MPDAPQSYLDPASLRREKQARDSSPLYWCHGSVTVWEYKQMSRPDQEQIQRECRAIEQGRQDAKKPAV